MPELTDQNKQKVEQEIKTNIEDFCEDFESIAPAKMSPNLQSLEITWLEDTQEVEFELKDVGFYWTFDFITDVIGEFFDLVIKGSLSYEVEEDWVDMNFNDIDAVFTIDRKPYVFKAKDIGVGVPEITNFGWGI